MTSGQFVTTPLSAGPTGSHTILVTVCVCVWKLFGWQDWEETYRAFISIARIDDKISSLGLN